MCVSSTLLKVVTVVFLVHVKNVTSRPFDGGVPVDRTTGESVMHNGAAASTVPMSKEMVKQVWTMSNKSWNLNLCESGIRLKMGKKTLNKKSFFCSKKNAMKLAPMLFGDGLEERVYVWCRLAALYSSINNSSSRTSVHNGFDVDDLMYFEGDIVLTRESVDDILAFYFPTPELQHESLSAARDYRKQNSPTRQKRKIVNSDRLWHKGIGLQYHIDSSFSSSARETILEALSEYRLATCIRFVPVPAEVKYSVIKFVKTNRHCNSELGRAEHSETRINLGPSCATFGIVTHEIGHALGFHHEHSRPDRDEYITVIKENVKSGFESSFLKQTFKSVKTYGVPYDYSSIMHYSASDLGEGKMTIRTNDPAMQQVIGQRVSLSFLDVKLLNIAYCSRVCGTRDLEWTECQNGGYLNPNKCASCVCPEGFAPPFCKEPSEGLNTAYTIFGGKSRLNNDRVNVDCGSQTLMATKEKQNWTSPGFDNAGMGNNAYCPWLIKASTPGKRVRLMFVGKFHFYKDPNLSVCEERVEVKYKDMSLPGPRHCGHITPKTTYRSHGSELLMTGQTLNYTTEWQGFQAIYTEENCGGCSEDSTNREPVCFRTVKYDCHYLPCDICKPIPNTCYRDEEYCCDGFNQADDLCIREGYSRLETISSINSPTSTTEPNTSTTQPPTSATIATTSTVKPTSSPEPTTSTSKPKTFTAKSTTSTAKATTSTDKPPNSTLKATTPTAKPPTSTSKPTSTTAKSTTPAAKPTLPTSTNIPIPTNERSQWSDWSACSATCGLCGVRTRRKFCFQGPCSGPAEEKEICGTAVCMEETVVESYKCTLTKKNCDKRFSINKCQVDSTCDLKKMIPMCCHGETDNKQCKIFFAARRGN